MFFTFNVRYNYVTFFMITWVFSGSLLDNYQEKWHIIRPPHHHTPVDRCSATV
jgi:hypothetical protein